MNHGGKTEKLTEQSCDRWTSQNCDNGDDNKSVEASAKEAATIVGRIT